MIAHFHLNWLAPVKIRQFISGGMKKKMIGFNDLIIEAAHGSVRDGGREIFLEKL